MAIWTPAQEKAYIERAKNFSKDFKKQHGRLPNREELLVNLKTADTTINKYLRDLNLYELGGTFLSLEEETKLADRLKELAKDSKTYSQKDLIQEFNSQGIKITKSSIGIRIKNLKLDLTALSGKEINPLPEYMKKWYEETVGTWDEGRRLGYMERYNAYGKYDNWVKRKKTQATEVGSKTLNKILKLKGETPGIQIGMISSSAQDPLFKRSIMLQFNPSGVRTPGTKVRSLGMKSFPPTKTGVEDAIKHYNKLNRGQGR